MKSTEEAGMREMRRELLSEASGKTIELGAGTGLNLELYPDTVSELDLTEPDPHMAKQLRARVEGSGRAARIAEAGAERLPFADDSFDTAVATLVFCTIPDPGAAVNELGRVLKPGGRLLFIEHVRAEDPGLARWQDRLEKPWRFLGDGCHCNRDTVATISASRLELDRVERGKLPKARPLVRPLVRGSAVLPA
jgi:ubiquinone/menaquinone biosynthesis C-methylase UbiE